MDFILKQNISHPNQYGFLRGCSTEQAMLDIIMKISDAIDNKEFAIGVFLDLPKAFDTISHSIANQRLLSYLSNKSQYVFFKNTSSSTQPISCGVPQGSVLGPLLFVLYINDISSISTQINFNFFADDTTGFYKSQSLDELTQYFVFYK